MIGTLPDFLNLSIAPLSFCLCSAHALFLVKSSDFILITVKSDIRPKVAMVCKREKSLFLILFCIPGRVLILLTGFSCFSQYLVLAGPLLSFPLALLMRYLCHFIAQDTFLQISPLAISPSMLTLKLWFNHSVSPSHFSS